MKRVIASLVLAAAGLWALPASARVHVVTTIQTFKVLTEEIGGDHVQVEALVGEAVDPHFVDARPSYAVTLNRADLLIYVGLDLERGWLPPLLEQARNPKIQAGQAGNLDASQAVAALDVGVGTRAEGDIHPLGNPHYWLPPNNALRVAREIADRLKVIDAGNAAAYEQGYAAFAAKVTKRMTVWAQAAAPLAGVKVVTYHKSWSYVTRWLGMVEIGYIEPKPGVPPDPQHLAELTRDAKSQGARFVIVESFYPQNTAQRVADLGGMKLAALPSDAGGSIQTYCDLIDLILAQLDADVGK